MKTLSSFRLPAELKEKFSIICQIKGSFMTTELIYLIEDFIKDQLSDDRVSYCYLNQLQKQGTKHHQDTGEIQ